jgi:hypothetical protein
MVSTSLAEGRVGGGEAGGLWIVSRH